MSTTSRTGNSRKRAAKPKSTARKSLGQLNRWMKANHDQLLDKAKRNSLTLTGKPTFGTTRTRKSA
jgi:hypothetical protein